MQTPARILRARADEIDPPKLTVRQAERHKRIMHLAQGIFASEGSHGISFTGLATAMRITPATLRFHFADLESLLGAIIRRHLRKLSTALQTIAPNARSRRRAAYLALTRNSDGSLTEAHSLLVHETPHLPDDVREPIERMRQALGEILAGTQAEEALLLLDTACLNKVQIEIALKALQPFAAPTQIHFINPGLLAPPTPADEPPPRQKPLWEVEQAGTG